MAHVLLWLESTGPGARSIERAGVIPLVRSCNAIWKRYLGPNGPGLMEGESRIPAPNGLCAEDHGSLCFKWILSIQIQWPGSSNLHRHHSSDVDFHKHDDLLSTLLFSIRQGSIHDRFPPNYQVSMCPLSTHGTFSTSRSCLPSCWDPLFVSIHAHWSHVLCVQPR